MRSNISCFLTFICFLFLTSSTYCSNTIVMVEICNNGIDDDGDGLIDCMDQDCFVTNSNSCISCLGDGLSFADVVIEYSPTCFADLDINVNTPENALGEPNYMVPSAGQSFGTNFVSLGFGGTVILGFTDNVLVNSGNSDSDLWVFEIGPAVEGTSVELRPVDNGTINILDNAGIIDSDGDGFFEFGNIGGATSSLDLDNLVTGLSYGSIKFDAVKLTDLAPGTPCAGSAGSDIDAVCALSSVSIEICNNGIDDDGDGLIDCLDEDCFVFNSNTCIPCLGDGLSFADIVIDYDPTCFEDLFPSVTDPAKALGESDYIPPGPGDITGQNFVSLGYGGNITLGFTNNILVNSGSSDNDIWIFEVGTKAEGTSVDLRPLNAATITIITNAGIQDVDGDGFYEFGGIGGATSGLDLDNLVGGLVFGAIQFDAVKLTDLNPGGFCFGTAGSDIEAVCALSNIPAEICDNGIDDDGDGDIDCADADLANDCCCLDPLPLDIGPNIELCEGNTATLDAGDNYDSYLWSTGETSSSISVTESSLYAVTVIDACQNLITDTIDVNIFPVVSTSISELICSGDSISINDITYNTIGLYEQTLISAIGCDSLLSITIESAPVANTFLFAEICQGDNYILNGQTYSESGSYEQTLETTLSCDSIINLNLTVLESSSTILEEEICKGDVITINGTSYDQSGTYEQMLINQDGCDSLITLNLNVFGESFSTDTYYILNGQSITINNEIFTDIGTYTQNFQTVDGCDSILLITIVESQQLIQYDLNQCRSYINDGDNEYDEFTPIYATDNCVALDASILYREMPDINKHSCTPGINGSKAACVSSVDACDFPAGDDRSLRIDIALDIPSDDSLKITSMSFYEKAPEMFDWIDGVTGPNNYPTLYGIRLLIDNVEIYRKINFQTTTDWTLEEFDLQSIDFIVTGESKIQIELVGYCTVDNGSTVNAWDIDEINLYGTCINASSNATRLVTGTIKNQQTSQLPAFTIDQEVDGSILQRKTQEDGFYAFANTESYDNIKITAYNDEHILQGLSTLDLIMIQKHILDINPFSSITQLVAADVNNTGSISALDLIQLQKVILGVDDQFANNHSWVGVNTKPNATLDNSTSIMIENNLAHSVNNDFIGVKIGDVSTDFNSYRADISTNRNIESIDLSIELQETTQGSTAIAIIPTETMLASGIQLSLQLDTEANNNITLDSEYLEITEANYNVTPDGIMTISIVNLSGIKLIEDQPLLTFNSHGNIAIANSINNNELLKSELYKHESDQVLDINWIIDFPENTITEVSTQGLQVYPNPTGGMFDLIFETSKNQFTTIQLIDMKGQLIYSNIVKSNHQTLATHRIDMDNQPEGVYYLQVIKGDTIESKKVVLLR